MTRTRRPHPSIPLPTGTRRVARLLVPPALNAWRPTMTSHTQTINTDFGHRSYQETSLFEMATVVDGIKYLYRNLARWMRPERRRVAYLPLGVPVSLGIALLLGAFAGPALSADAITADTAVNYR